MERLEMLPGWEIVSKGLADVSAGRVTPFACLVWIALPRLRRAGLVDDALLVRRLSDPEVTLYRLLGRDAGDAYGRYNALLRRLVRFEHGLDRAAAAELSSPFGHVRV